MQSHIIFMIILTGVTVLISFYFERQFCEIGVYFLSCKECNEMLGGPLTDISNVNITLFIGILSTPDHFRQRQSQRQTWLNLLPDTFQYRFVVGEKGCRIHPLDRKSPYTCEELNYIIPENSTEKSLLYANSVRLPDTCNEDSENNIGFSFHVHHPMVVRHLGLKRSNYILNKDSVIKVILTDLHNSEEITSVEFECDSLLKELRNSDYVFKRLITPVILPKGFEGVVKVEGLSGHVQQKSDEDATEWTHGNMLSVLNIISRNPNQSSTNYCGFSTFSFTIKGLVFVV